MDRDTAIEVAETIRGSHPGLNVTLYTDGRLCALWVSTPQTGVIPPPWIGETGLRLAHQGEAPISASRPGGSTDAST